MKTAPLYGTVALWRDKPLTKNDADYATRATAAIQLTDEVLEARDLSELACKLNDIHNQQLDAGRPPLPPALRALAYTYLNDALDGPEADLDVALYLFGDRADCNAFCAKSGGEVLIFGGPDAA